MSKMFEFDDWFWIVTLILGRIHWELAFKGETRLGAFILFLWGLFMLLESKMEEFENEIWKRKVMS